VSVSLAGKAIVITGSGRGLGRAFARAAVEAGASVVINDVDAAVAEATARELGSGGGRVVHHVSSVASWDEARALIGACVEAFGRVDGLVNNAGVHYLRAPMEETERELRQIVEVNVLGPMFAGLHAMHAMAASGGGSIVNIGSEGMMGYRDMGAYAATKGAVASLTLGWAHHLDQTGVRVNAVAPNAQTRMSPVDENGNVLPRPAAESVAPVIVYLLSDASAALNGKILKFNGTTLAPIIPATVSSDGETRVSWTADDIAEACAGELAEVIEHASGQAAHSAAR
jgi:NAD(P)-dependent dehydrogenase (short-subunit alcohol dehydrogenase family)